MRLTSDAALVLYIRASDHLNVNEEGEEAALD